ncbi:hypothetical protein RSO68_11710 [Halomonas saccharevitans]|uniref:DUF4124 domain-containing protein n=1 Tax=Halomonas saccharevitans TaxID=416872 RepID=A0ABU3NG40_9GAMM|nr:hypothetical protein [Halomonas saccharevitans]MDT8880144.1 hypothetical protein [Halomonas saccharevitans]
MRYTAMALLVLPLMGQAQIMKCPDGSYSDRCPGGEAFQGGGISHYAAPEPRSLAPPLETRPDTDRSRARDGFAGSTLSRPTPGPSSVAERAQGMGISRNELVKARSRGTILIGMEEKDVIDILGQPDDVDINGGYGSRCKTMRWYNRRDDLPDYVSTCDGRVDYFSNG